MAGDLSPLHSKTGSQLTKVTIPGGSLLRRAAGPREAADFVIIFYHLAKMWTALGSHCQIKSPFTP